MEVNMFFKSNFRPAFAGATPDGQARNGKLKNEAFTFNNAADTDDYGTYTAGSKAPRSGKSAPRKGGSKSSWNRPAIIIAAAAVGVLLVLALVIGAVLVFGGNGDINFTKDSYVSFSDAEGTYKVAANGKIVKSFENPVELIVATDRSFAYVVETSDEGKMVYLIEGDKVTDITTAPITKILATAALEPAVVWLDEANGVYHYTKKVGESNRITRNYALTLADSDNHSFCISADGETVAYTEFNEEKGDTYLYIYEDGSETRMQKNMYPIALSDNGSLIYATASKDGVTKSLYVIPKNGDSDQYLIAEKFRSIIDFNIKGNEIVYTAWDSEDLVATFVVAFNLRKMNEEIIPTRIVKGAVVYPVSTDGKVARFETFKDTYFQCDPKDAGYALADNRTPVYYVDKKFTPNKISYYTGQFDPNGNYYYYINPSNDKLIQIDLSTDELITNTIDEGVEDFAVTNKGNIYILNDDALRYYKVSKEKSSKICEDVIGISMHKYTNTLYFTIEDAVSVYRTEEGSSKEQAKFDGNNLTGLPVFTDTNAKRGFVGFFDEDNEEWRLYYTSNGSKYKFMAICEDVAQFDNGITIDDIIDGIVDAIT